MVQGSENTVIDRHRALRETDKLSQMSSVDVNVFVDVSTGLPSSGLFVLQTCAGRILMGASVVYKGFCEYDNYGFLNG